MTRKPTRAEVLAAEDRARRQAWYDNQTEKSLLYELFLLQEKGVEHLNNIRTVASVWLVLTILGIILACVAWALGSL